MNIKELSDVHGLTVEEFTGILKVFVETARVDIGKIQAAVERGDAHAAGEAAHSLKGAAGNLGFKALSELARAAEINAGNDDLGKITPTLPVLTGQVEEINSQLNDGR
jgi:HPt (histidine-containing phosphotransfer) domain-containing protein